MKVSVIAHPNSKKPRIEKDLFNKFHVYVNQPPLRGQANKVIIETLAKYFNTKKSKITLISGIRSKNKIFEIIKI